MLLTDARRPARLDDEGRLVPLAEQDRRRWDAAAIAEGTGLLAATLVAYPIGRYQAQAAIAAVHAEAARAEDTDWPQILALYEVLAALAPGPVVTLNRIVALAMVDGPDAALAQPGRRGRRPRARRVPPRGTPSARTCWSRRAMGRAPVRSTGARPSSPSASPNARTSSTARPVAECVLSIRA